MGLGALAIVLAIGAAHMDKMWLFILAVCAALLSIVLDRS